jgi:hypothetical protein
MNLGMDWTICFLALFTGFIKVNCVICLANLTREYSSRVYELLSALVEQEE